MVHVGDDFFYQATLRICGNLDIEAMLSDCLEFLKDVLPADAIALQVYDLSSGIFEDLYYELNKSILLIELSERETLAQVKKDSLRILTGIFARAKSISNLSTITNTDIKEFKLDFETEGRTFSFVILNGHDADNLPVYSSVLTMPEYKSVAQYVDLDTLYEKLLKVLRAKNIADPEGILLDALRPHDRTAQNASPSILGA